MSGDLYRVVTYIFRPGSEELFGLKPGFCIMSLKPASAYDCGKARDAGRVRRLKCWPHYFDKIRSGEKDWELRADDRVPPYEVGDVLEIYRFEPTAPAPLCAHGGCANPPAMYISWVGAKEPWLYFCEDHKLDTSEWPKSPR